MRKKNTGSPGVGGIPLTRRALRLARKAHVKRFGLFHHNQNRSDADLEKIVDECHSINGDKHVDMDCFALTQTTCLTL